MRRRRFGRDEVVFHEGEIGDTVHVIEKGRVLVEVSTARGDVAALSVRGPGDMIGELAIVGGGRRSARVTTLEPTETLSLTQATLDDLRKEDPRVDRYLLELLARKMQETTAQLVEVLFIGVEKRVLRVVDRLASAFDDGDGGPIVLRVRQEDIEWIEAAGDYMCVHAQGETHIMRKTMKELEDELEADFLQRIHRSTIVNIRQVTEMRSHINGEYFLKLQSGHTVKLSRTYKDKLRFLHPA